MAGDGLMIQSGEPAEFPTGFKEVGSAAFLAIEGGGRASLLLLGPPGAGKSMLARRLSTIMPTMTLAEAIETTRIHSVAGLTGNRTALVTTRPCRAPHHTISDAGLIGGGHLPRPGEVSPAHHGMLFPDARPECRRDVLEVLRQLLEEGVTSRTSRTVAAIFGKKRSCFARISIISRLFYS
jgi:magnesium chelatase family protein